MDHLPDLAIALARWLDGPVTTLLALVAGYFGARLIGAGAQKRPAADPGTDGGHPVAPGRRGTDPQAEPLDGDTLESLESPTRLYEMRAQLERLEQENRYLEQAAAHRGADIQVLAARMNEAAARDREELVHLQDEIEAEQRGGFEKARLIRSLEASLHRAETRLQDARADRERQRVSLAALQAALTHAKRAQARTEGRLAELREQLRMQGVAAPAQGPATVERIVEIPVETIVYRDREVTVEVPIEVPVGFTALPPPAVAALKPRYSENRPTST